MQGVGAVNKEQLSQLRYLKKEVLLLQNQIENIDYKITTDSVEGSLPTFPYTKHTIKITGIDEQDYKRKIDRLKNQLLNRVKELISLVDETNKYIDKIDDSLIRQIMMLRYVNGLTWEQVATDIGGNNSADSVRKAAERYLK